MKNISVLLVLFLLHITLSAQPAFEWTKIDTCNTSSAGRSVVTDGSNYSYVGGEYRGTAIFQTVTISSTSPTSTSPVCGFLAKYDSAGNVIWVKNLLSGTQNTDAVIVEDVAVDDDGNIYVGGYYSDTLSIDGNIINSYSVILSGFASAWFFAKFDANGNVQWLTDWDVYLYTSHLTTITVDHSGSCIGVGVDGVGQSAMVKLTPAGATDWSWRDTWSGSAIYDVSVDAANNIYFPMVTNGNEHFGSLVLPSAGTSQHLMVVKLDPSGNGLWYYYPTQFFTQGLPGERTFVIATTDAGISFLACHWNFALGTDTFTTYDLALLKIDSSGSAVDARYITHGDNQGADKVGAICLNDAGQVLVQGSCYGTTVLLGDDSLTFTFFDGTNKMFIAQFEQSLDYDWGITSGAEVIVGYSSSGNAGGISSHGDDIYYCGTVPGHVVFGNDTISASYDMFVGKLGTAGTGVNEVFATKKILNVYPDPASQFLQCSWQAAGIITGEISLYDLSGRKIIQQPVHSNSQSVMIDVSQLPEGIYFLNVAAENFDATEKLNVIH